ncbi:serine hydrolase [Nonomuraea sp. NPDC050691]|uniref:serine hydrolase n=1 Tax=Nonomuraea sp. NPDC050691 TaxID=3155661 RepID=UPI0033C9559D
MIVGRALRRAALVTLLVAPPAALAPPALTSPVPAIVALKSPQPGPGTNSFIELTLNKAADAEDAKDAENAMGAKVVKEANKKAAPVPAKTLTKQLDRYLAGRSGPVTAMVRDLTDGRLYRYHRDERLITASSAKVQILMALLLRTPWRKLPTAVRRDADLMIRYSDNHAADRLWSRIGGPDGFTRAGRAFGLRHTSGVPGRCVDLYCWGITPTSAEDQVRLVRALVSDRSPLPEKDREQVLRLMGRVVAGQDWGISAAACGRDRVALKNGWLKRVSTKRWAVVTVGLIRGRGKGAAGHDYAVAVLSEGAAEVGYGIATVEGVAKRVMKAFRTCRRS